MRPACRYAQRAVSDGRIAGISPLCHRSQLFITIPRQSRVILFTSDREDYNSRYSIVKIRVSRISCISHGVIAKRLPANPRMPQPRTGLHRYILDYFSTIFPPAT